RRQGRRGPRPVHRPHRRGGGAGRRRVPDHRRPRQRRADGGPGQRPGPHLPHHRAGAADLRRAPGHQASIRRQPGGYRPHPAAPDGPAGAGGNDRPQPGDRPLSSRGPGGTMWRILLPLTLALACSLALGDDKAREKREEAKLRALEQDIKALRETLDKRGGERRDLAAELKEHELAVSAINQKITALDASIARLNDELMALDDRKAALVEQRRAQEALIARE